MKKRLFILLIPILWIFATSLFMDYKVESKRIIQMGQCFKDLQIPCRWVPDLSFKYGSPFFNYYPPLPYYFGATIYLLSGNLFISTLIFPTLFLLIPLTFWKFFSFAKQVTVINALFFSILITVLFLSHNILTVVFLLVFLIWGGYKYLFKKQKKQVFYMLLSLSVAFGLSAFYLLPLIFERNLVYLDPSLDYLPKYALEVPRESAQNPYQVLTGDSFISDFNKGSNYFNFRIDTKTHTIIRLSQYYFPNWQIFIDGIESKFEYKDNSLGLITIILGEGNHKIEGKFSDTSIRIISNIITIVSLLLILITYLYQKKLIKKWVSYYRKGIS